MELSQRYPGVWPSDTSIEKCQEAFLTFGRMANFSLAIHSRRMSDHPSSYRLAVIFGVVAVGGFLIPPGHVRRIGSPAWASI